MKALLCGYYGQGNAGDEALLVSLLQMLPPEVKPIVLSANPAETRKLYDVASCPRKSSFAVWKALKQSDCFIWGGGSLMQDATSFASPIYYGGLMALAQQQGLKTIAWAQGIGPLNRSFTKWLTSNVLLGCDAVSVRDEASAKLVRDWQMEPLVAPDPVWALTSKSIPSDLIKSDAPKVAVNLRSHPELTPQRLELLSKALQSFQEQTNTFILLVPFQAAKDLAIAKKLHQDLPETSQIISLQDPRELKGLFQHVSMTIGMRLHSLIMAAAEQSACFALSYDPKVSQLMMEYEFPGWEMAEIPNSVEIITNVWIEHFNKANFLKIDSIKTIKSQALTHQKLLSEFL